MTAVCVGACYGLNTPSGSQVLSRAFSPRRRGFAFSIKQSGAPLGAMLAGFALPLLVLTSSWQQSLLFVTVLGLIATLFAQPLRGRIDGPTNRSSATNSGTAFAALRIVLANKALRGVTLGAFALMVVHSSYQVFFVAFLVESIGFSLIEAGLLFGVLQFAGASSRVTLGWYVDRFGNARAVLVALSVAASVISLFVTALDASWAPAWIWLTCAIAGIASAGWYGIFLAEITTIAGRNEAGHATGGVLFFVYFGHVAGPIALALVVGTQGDYKFAF